MSSEETALERDDDDITFISQFLGDSHPSDFSVVKELLQNAHDAKATRLDIVLHEGLPDPDAGPILNRAGILVLNDGDVEDRDLKAIGGIQRTTKAQDTGRIGRFGRGQKAVFRWSDAFVALRLKDEKILTRLPRPLNSRRTDWHAVEPAAFRRLFESFGAGADDAPPRNRGLALWLPLRKPQDPLPKVFTDSLDLKRLSNELLQPKDWLAATVSLGMHHIRVWRSSAASDGPALHVDLSHKQRGHLRLADQTVRFWQSSAPEAAGDVRHADRTLVDHPLWPHQMQRQENDTPRAVKQKASFHARVTIIAQPVVRGEEAQLSVRWAVSLPLDSSPVVESTRLADGDHHITVMLDGSFFLDSGRRAPLGINRGRDDGDIQDEGELKNAWNQAVRDDHLLPMVVPTLAAMAKEIAPAEMLRVVDALAKTPLLEEPFADAVLSKQRLVAALERTDGGGLVIAWTAVPTGSPLLPLDLPEGTSLEVLAECFPNLVAASESTTNGSGPHVVHRDWSRRLGGEIDTAHWHDQLNRLAPTPDLLFDGPRHLSTVLSIWEKNVAPLGDSQRAWLRNRRRDLARDLLQHSDWGPDVGALAKKHLWEAAKGLLSTLEDRIVVVDPSGFTGEFDELARAIAEQTDLLLLRTPKVDPVWRPEAYLSCAEGDRSIEELILTATTHLSRPDDRARLLFETLRRVTERDRARVLSLPTVSASPVLQANVAGEPRWLSPASLRSFASKGRLIRQYVADHHRPSLPLVRSCLPSVDVAELRNGPAVELAGAVLDDRVSLLEPHHALRWAADSVRFAGTAEERVRLAAFLLKAEPSDIGPVLRVLSGRADAGGNRMLIAPTGPDGSVRGTQHNDAARGLHDALARADARFLDVDTSDAVQDELTRTTWRRFLEEPGPRKLLQAALHAGVSADHWAAVAHHLAEITQGELDEHLRKELSKTSWLPCRDGSTASPSELLDLPEALVQMLREHKRELRLPTDLAPKLQDDQRLMGAVRGLCPADTELLETLVLQASEVVPKILPQELGRLVSRPEASSIIRHLRDRAPAWEVVALALESGRWPADRVLSHAADLLCLCEPLDKVEDVVASLDALATLAQSSSESSRTAQAWHLELCATLAHQLDRTELQRLFEENRSLPTVAGTWRPANELVRALGARGVPKERLLLKTYEDAFFGESEARDLACTESRVSYDERAELLSAKEFLLPLAEQFEPYVEPKLALGCLLLALAPNEIRNETVAFFDDEATYDECREALLGSGTDSAQSRRSEAQSRRIEGVTIKFVRPMDPAAGSDSRSEAFEVVSITGDSILMDFPEAISDDTSLCIGQALKDPATGAFPVRLRSIDPRMMNQTDLVRIIRNTIAAVAMDCYGVTPVGLTERLDGWATADQLPLRVTREALADVLYLCPVPCADFRDRVRDVNKARYELARWNASNRTEFANNRRRTLREARDALERLVVESDDVASRLLELQREHVRRYDYAHEQVLFELFQNADDACWDLAKTGSYDDFVDSPPAFHVWGHDGWLAVGYGGRAINQRLPGETDTRGQGYDQDLEMMCRLGTSAKPLDPDRTGQFGLGFKTVYLLTDRPQIWSGDLRFAIRGGLLPVEADADEVECLRELRDDVTRSLTRGVRATVIRLPYGEGRSADAQAALDRFKTSAPLLTLFSKVIRRIYMHEADGNIVTVDRWVAAPVSSALSELRWRGHRFVATTSEHQVPEQKSRRPNSSVRADSWHLVWAIQDGRPVGLDSVRGLDKAGGLWCVAPTAEGRDLHFALNGPLQLDAGRGSIARHRSADLHRLRATGWAMARALVSAYADREYAWWAALWGKVFAKALDHKERLGKILAALLVGTPEAPGLLRHLANKGFLPNDVPGYEALTGPSDVQLVVDTKDKVALSELERVLELRGLTAASVCSVPTKSWLKKLDFSEVEKKPRLTPLMVLQWEIEAREPCGAQDLVRLHELVERLESKDHQEARSIVSAVGVRTRDGNLRPLGEVVAPWSPHHEIAPDSRAIDERLDGPLPGIERCFKSVDSRAIVEWIVRLSAGSHGRQLSALGYLARHVRPSAQMAEDIRGHRDQCWLRHVKEGSRLLADAQLDPNDEKLLLLIVWGPQASVATPAAAEPAVTQQSSDDVTENLRRLEEWWSDPSQAKRVEEAQELKAVDPRKRVDLRIGVYAAVGLSPSELTEVLGRPKHGDFGFTWFKLLCALNALGAWPFEWDRAVKFIDRAHRKGVFDSIWKGEGEEARTKALNDLFSADGDSTNYWRHLLDFEKLASLTQGTEHSRFAELILSEAQSAEGRHIVARVTHLGKAPGMPALPAPRSSLKKYVFLLLRELHRLGVAPNQPHGFFPSNRVLQLCHRLGLVDNDKIHTDFDKLCDQVEGIVEQLDQHDGLPQLRHWRDAPFFAYAKTMCERFEGCDRCEMVCRMKDPRRRATANGARPSS